ncbi:twin-arginine translocation signal domain-containing protein [Micromonospora sp. KC207]|uniref:twin-arginine translocation signal domain-containing protein n=1 Tax=Micromonospora sp. KC207 TaxID=2530377 RepID=UPI00104BF213|nr:twin-arginine translocation signal domain-containing protein [Micromonospora sp. KC207]TDC64288.1 twin-arginine translocation signal domain-containing protein [Micromonospora sp. KC207]
MSHPPLTRRSLLAGLGAGGVAAADSGWIRALPAHAVIPDPSNYSQTWASVGQHPAAESFQDVEFGLT